MGDVGVWRPRATPPVVRSGVDAVGTGMLKRRGSPLVENTKFVGFLCFLVA